MREAGSCESRALQLCLCGCELVAQTTLRGPSAGSMTMLSWTPTLLASEIGPLLVSVAAGN